MLRQFSSQDEASKQASPDYSPAFLREQETEKNVLSAASLRAIELFLF
jgi:hypothetical protein